MLENKVRMKYIGIIYDCTLIGTKHKNKQVLINDHKDLNNLIQEMDKKTKGSLIEPFFIFGDIFAER